MDLIVAVDKNWGIGKDGQLLASLKADQVRFRDLTLGQVVIYGRKTLESFPGGKPLPGRTNIILSRSKTFAADGAYICRELAALPGLLASFRDKRYWVIGGDSIYRQLLPYCRQAYVTLLDREYPADRHFPNLDRMEDWQLVEDSQWQQDADRLDPEQIKVKFKYLLYARKTSPLDIRSSAGGSK